MKQILSNLLHYPIEQELIDQVDLNKNVLFLNCLPVANLKNISDCDVFNFYKNDQIKWPKDSSFIFDLSNDKKYDFIFCALPKNKIEGFYYIALIAQSLNPAGRVIIAASNDLGGKSLPKWMAEHGFAGESYSKKKCRIFTGTLENPNHNVIQKSFKNAEIQEISMDGVSYKTQAGVFGWNKIDVGSKLLIENMGDELFGAGADFGCGYGYLSHQILSRQCNIKKLYALDVDYRAVSCTRNNLKKFETEIICEWTDLTRPYPFKEKLNWIVMNPPFHEGKERKDYIGQTMIERAYEALGKTGVLYMVANNHLPYERTLSMFSKIEKLTEENGFKVYKAIK